MPEAGVPAIGTDTDVSQNLKMTELGPLPTEWRVVRLGEIASVRGGVSFPPKYQGMTEGDYPFFKVSDMNMPDNDIEMTTANNYVSEEVRRELGAKPFPPGTIIFPKVGGALHTNKKRILQKASLIDNNLMGVTVTDRERCDPMFLLYWIWGIRLSDICNLGPLPSINAARVKNLLIPLPPLSEQRAIAHILWTIQRVARATQRVIAATREFKKSLMRYLFRCGPVPVEKADRVSLKETEIGPVPVHWQVVKLGDVVNVRTQLIDPGLLCDNVRYVGLEHIDSGSTFLRRWGRSSEIRSAKTKFYAGDVLYGKLRPYLDKAVLAEFEGVCSTDILVFRCVDETVYNGYLAHYLHSQSFVAYAISTTTGVNHPRTSWGALRGMRIPVPPLQEQKEIANMLTAVEQKIAVEEAYMKALEGFFSAMLHLLMTGRLRVKGLPLSASEGVSSGASRE